MAEAHYIDAKEVISIKGKHPSHSKSLLAKFLLPFLLILGGQAALFYGTSFLIGAISQIADNAYQLLDQRTMGRKNDLESDMVHRWSSLSEPVENINAQMDRYIAQYGSSAAVTGNPQRVEDFLLDASQSIIYTLRKNSVTGAFVVLNSPYMPQGQMPGLYILNRDPETTTTDNSDLAVRRGSATLYRKLGITTDTFWSPAFDFSGQPEAAAAFVRQPMEAARDYPTLSLQDMGYWSPSFSLDGQCAPTITYSLPLIDSQGKIYGVMGVDISQEHLRKQLNYRELSTSSRGVYGLALAGDAPGSLHPFFLSGASTMRESLPAQLELSSLQPAYNLWQLTNSGNGSKVYANVQYLNLYNTNTPHSDQQWALVSVLEDRYLLQLYHSINRTAALTALLSIAVGIVLTLALLMGLMRPITGLIMQLRASNPLQPIKLGSAGITEIDELAGAIEEMSQQVSLASSQLTRVIELSGVPIAAFEVNLGLQVVRFTKQLYPLLGLSTPNPMVEQLGVPQFRAMFDGCSPELEEELPGGWLVRIVTEKKMVRWLRVIARQDEGKLLGVVTDVTDDTLQKRRLAYERDYDLLTNLLNRRAFLAVMDKLFLQPDKLQVAALIMLDLDNLKHLNDSYGHDCGDSYIQAAAAALKKLPLQNMVVARMSGDEFFVFLYGYSSQDELRGIIQEIKETILGSYFTPPGAEGIRIRCSGGIAWYPQDADSVEVLCRYADFAMYTAKNNKKGTFFEFDQQSYNQNAFLLHAREELNKLIDHQMIHYLFQPIVSTADGQVFAYEALMRPTLDTLKTPQEVLTLARAQSKLYDIEKLTWFCALRQARAEPSFTQGSFRLFINSVSNQILTPADSQALRQLYGRYLGRVVLEVTEEEKFAEELSRQKQSFMYSFGGQIALDDFGTGYNSDTALLLLSPDYVKIDMSIVRSIDSDRSRQGIFKNLVAYSHERDIKVIAEGVETFQEMQTLIQLGADYLQGYYLGHPQAEMRAIPADLSEEIRNIRNSPTGPVVNC